MAAPPEKESKSGIQTTCANFQNFLYSKREHNGVEQTLVMGRPGNSWAKIGLFYICFYSFLAGFFAAMLSVFLSTVQSPGEGGPKLTQFIANKPGLTIVNPVSSAYNSSQGSENLKQFTKTVADFLKNYQDNTVYNASKPCMGKDTAGYVGTMPCTFNYKAALTNNCTEGNSYGMSLKMPCILVRMNKVYDWVPAGSDEQLKLNCDESSQKVTVHSGFLKAAMPFRGQDGYENPIAVVQVPQSDSAVILKCYLEGEGIEVSDSYNPKRSFGKIEFTVEPALKPALKW